MRIVDASGWHFVFLTLKPLDQQFSMCVPQTHSIGIPRKRRRKGTSQALPGPAESETLEMSASKLLTGLSGDSSVHKV